MELPRQRLFTNKALVSLLIPLFMEQLLGTLVGMVDGIMVSSVGESAISAVALVGNISAVMLHLFTALAVGGSIVTSQMIGAGDVSRARRSAPFRSLRHKKRGQPAPRQWPQAGSPA